MESTGTGRTGSDKLGYLLSGARFLAWDFDGVVADTEPLQQAAFLEVLHRHGVEPPRDFFNDLIGTPEVQVWERLRTHYDIGATVEALQKERHAIYVDLTESNLRPAWYVQPILESTSRAGTPNYVVSSGSYRNVGRLLDDLGLLTSFSRVFCDGSPDIEGSFPGKRAALAALGSGGVLIDDHLVWLRMARSEFGLNTIGVRHSLNHLTAADADLLLTL